MIIVNAPLKRDFIRALLDGKTIENVTFTFVKQDNMKLYFSVEGDPKAAVKIAKNTIKQSEFGSVLFFNVEEHVG
ncbi:MAG: hypothetical protein A2Y20_04210 [Firmicutes bacterium GWF2_51_9]|nr:MAG: hypothetical protein A2Y20_04210 [Firmicutes bacterium GWF2_51_9]OGS59633.1 MAG: hypothetical protein A2Y19_01790 [Firmicutes bacterium GWE2_51_13]HAO60834.1 hypothetical protein [Erysipelotrichaceae bacterium]HBZ41603.1 hypothetical protein [Erysipelotrichaceae bacterium]